MKRKLEPIKDINMYEITKLRELVQQMQDSGGFTAKKVGIAADILNKMYRDKDCTIFLSFPACIVATGTRGIIRDIVKSRLVDAIITTCGTLDHDLARIWADYHHGDFLMDDVRLHKEGINRLGNILIPNESYGIILEKKLQPIFKQLWQDGKRNLSTKELVWELGEKITKEKSKSRVKNSIVYWATKNRIPIFIPGITDGAVGFQLWMFTQEHRDFKIDPLKDEEELSDIVFKANKTGALMVGGGISKHHTIWWNQFKGGLDYAVYITTAEEYDGSLSGARMREAVSWGKVREDAKYITVEGDATVILPLIFGGVNFLKRKTSI
jgi:deoxyhypusine synthase